MDEQLELTGERYLPSMDPKTLGVEIHYEHLHRYHFASMFVKGKEVLDLGCGEGYGSNILSKYAKHVVGIDYDEKTINYARKKYRKRNLKFIQTSATNILNFDRKKFDVIVCFEIIEHLEDHNRLLSEAKRMLRDKGILIISTPDKRIFESKRQPGYRNIFHKKELNFNEFELLLRSKFKYIFFFGQRVYTGSHIWPLSESTTACNEYVIEKRRNEFPLVKGNLKEPLYFIAIVSNRKLEKPHFCFRSYLTDASNTIVERIRFLEKQIICLNSDIEKIKSSLAYRIYMKIRNIIPIK